ncbi:hypothetical protein [Thermaerobacter litoralis]
MGSGFDVGVDRLFFQAGGNRPAAPAPSGRGVEGPTREVDPAVVPPLVRLFVQALRELAAAGETERACMMAAQGWSLLRHGYPREAQRLNGLLHALTGATHRHRDGDG